MTRWLCLGLSIYTFQTTIAQSNQNIYINELMASNDTTIADSTNAYEDWIEIYNTSAASYDLSDHYLSDDPSNLTKYQIPTNTFLVAGSYLIFWASGDASRGLHHTNFRLSASQGEYVIITAPNGIDIIDSVSFGPQRTDVSYGRYPDGSNQWAYFKAPTPGESNNTVTPKTSILEAPVFSHTGGFESSGFSLSLSAPDSGVTIYYTLDGSEPSPDNLAAKTYTYKNQYPQFANSPVGPALTDSIQTMTYSGPISIADRTTAPNKTSGKSTTFEASPNYLQTSPINKGTVVRAIAVRADAVSSEVATETYFVGSSLQNHYSLPVVSLSIDENLLFDVDEGIYCAGTTFENWRSNTNAPARGNSPANYRWTGREHEYRMGFEYFNTQGDKEFGQLVGARIHGGFTRARRRKALRFYPRSSYGKSHFDFPFFTNRSDTKYKRLLLRNSGNDERNTQYRDAFIQNLVKHLSFDIQESEAAIVFINGEYWGIHNFREWQNRHYIKRLYNVDREELDFIGERMDVKDGDSVHFNQLLEYVSQNDLSDDSLFAHINTQMDLDNFTDYVIAQVFSRNSDWPDNNIKWWRKRVPYTPGAPEGHDGRWRWLAYDMDFGFGWHRGLNEVNQNTLQIARDEAEVGVLLRNLWPNADYRRYFINRYADLMNTCFLPSHVEGVVDSMTAIYQPEINEHAQRWRHFTGVSQWMFEVNLIKTWSTLRPEHARAHVMNEFNLADKHQLDVDVNDTLMGYVRVNTIDILEQTVGITSSPYPWSGIYFENNSIDLSAHPFPGYLFSHWEVNGATITDDSIDFYMESDSTIIAHFISDTNIVCGNQASHILADCPYIFDEWSDQSAVGTTPPNIEFVYFDETDPSDTASIAGLTSGAFDLSSRTRINGLNDEGIGFINTGNSDGNPGYPGTTLGGAVLYLNTENMNRGFVQFTAGTIIPGSRAYHLRLQYRLGDYGPWQDLLDSNGHPIEYERNANFSHSEIIGPHPLPPTLMGRECLQLMWRYHYTGQRISQNSGVRDFIRLDDIIVSEGKAPSSPITTLQGTGAGDIQGDLVVLPSETSTYQIDHIPGASYDWTVTQGRIVAGQNTPQITVEWDDNGVGLLRVDIQDNNCLREAEAAISISGLNTKTHKNEGQILVYPNPAKDSFFVQIESDLNAKNIRLTDATGRRVLQKNIEGKEESQIGHSLSSGNYFLQITDDNESIIHEQVIILAP
ncbi:MAG: CotH kinase family protein [Cryomorphaceae bacterium]|nr:CotH kinase family protein [Cryomorphaceae bacterium]